MLHKCAGVLISLLFIGQHAFAGNFHQHFKKHRDEPVFCTRDMSSMRMLIVAFRYGDITPEATFPTDIYQEGTWPNGFGQLTRRGIERSYELGRWTRDCYDAFLHKNVSPKRVFVRSSDLDRTLQSAQAHLAGVYPPTTTFQTGIQTWGDTCQIKLGEEWHPFSVHTVPVKYDALLKGDYNCPRYDELTKQIDFSKKVKAILSRDKKFVKKIFLQAGIKGNDLLQVVSIVSKAVLNEVAHGLNPVAWLNSESDLDKLAYYRDLIVGLYFNNPELAKIVSGALIADIVSRISDRAHNKSTIEHVMYSTHAQNMLGFLSSLGVLNTLGHPEPPYGSAILIELHKLQDNSYAVATFYRNMSTHEPIPLKIPGCAPVDDSSDSDGKKSGDDSKTENTNSLSFSMPPETHHKNSHNNKQTRIFCRLKDFIRVLSAKATRNHTADCLPKSQRMVARNDSKSSSESDYSSSQSKKRHDSNSDSWFDDFSNESKKKQRKPAPHSSDASSAKQKKAPKKKQAHSTSSFEDSSSEDHHSHSDSSDSEKAKKKSNKKPNFSLSDDSSLGNELKKK